MGNHFTRTKRWFLHGERWRYIKCDCGSFYLAISATVLAFLISLPVALFINIYLIKYRRMLVGIRFFLDVLWAYLLLFMVLLFLC